MFSDPSPGQENSSRVFIESIGPLSVSARMSASSILLPLYADKGMTGMRCLADELRIQPKGS